MVSALSRDGHVTGAASKDPPGEQRADERVPKGNPHRLDAEAPAQPAGVTDEQHGREIGGAVRERAHPWSERAPPQKEVADVLGAFHAPIPDGQHHRDVQDDQCGINQWIHGFSTRFGDDVSP